MRKYLSILLCLLIIFSNVGIVPVYAATTVYTCSTPYRNSTYYQRLMQVNLTGNHRTDMINVAKSQIGYREGDCDADLSGWNDGSHSSNNYCEYNYWYYGGAHNGGSAYPWCATFVSWCARQANIPTTILKNSSAAGHSSSYFNIPYYSGSSYTPQPGDLFFTSSWSHVGIVESVSGNSFTTIEGNTNASGSSNGDGVYNRTRYGLSNYYFGVPNYSTDAATPPDTESPTYTVTLNANGGSTAINSLTASYNSACRLESNNFPTRDCHIFNGWSENPNATVATYTGTIDSCINRDITLYAVWIKGNYTVKFNANGGINAPSNVTTLYDSICSVSTFPTRKNHTFNGWSENPNATVATYTGAINCCVNKNVTLYAVWKRHSYSITFDANGGTDGPKSITLPVNESCLIEKTQFPIREGYTLWGWSRYKDATVATYYDSVDACFNEDVTLYAVWLKNATVTYDVNGGEGVNFTQSKPYKSDMYITEIIPTRKNHKFLGWSSNNSAVVAEYRAGDTYSVNENLTLYAVWEELPHTKIYTNKTKFNIEVYSLNKGCLVILALYKGDRFVKMYHSTYDGVTIPFTVTEDYDDFKVMVWESFKTLTPLCEANSTATIIE